MGDGGLGIGPNPQSPIPNPQSPIPKYIKYKYYIIIFLFKQIYQSFDLKKINFKKLMTFNIRNQKIFVKNNSRTKKLFIEKILFIDNFYRLKC